MFRLFPKTVDGVLANFRQTVEDLRAINQRCTQEIASKQEQIESLVSERGALEVEALSAFNHANNIENMLNGSKA